MTALLNLAENLATQEQAGELTFRVAPSGGVSVYGLGRFPTTLYPDQWDRILTKAAELQDFIAKNKASLKYKTPKAPKPEVVS
jgi:hypothetical protein